MEFNFEKEKDILMIDIDLDIDATECKKIRNIIDGYIIKYQPKEIVFNMQNVEFMDSSGIGLLMGRYNLAKMFNSRIIIDKPSARVKKVIQLTDINKYIEVTEG